MRLMALTWLITKRVLNMYSPSKTRLVPFGEFYFRFTPIISPLKQHVFTKVTNLADLADYHCCTPPETRQMPTSYSAPY